MGKITFVQGPAQKNRLLLHPHLFIFNFDTFLLEEVTVIRGLIFDPGLWSGVSDPGFDFDLGFGFDPGFDFDPGFHWG